MYKQPIVFDVDGTLTAEDYRLDNLRTLRPNPSMVLVALALSGERPLLISTARPEWLEEDTEAWLYSHGLSPEKLYMRSSLDDGIPDYLVKLDHLRKIRDSYGNPYLWVDDNTEVVEMLRSNNVTVIAMNPAL
jgi:hypothetical protein